MEDKAGTGILGIGYRVNIGAEVRSKRKRKSGKPQ